MLGLNKGEVKLVPHNPEWTELFQQEKQLLNSLIGDVAVAIEHIGSTAIKGIKAKPIIDMMVGLKQLDNARDLDMRRMSEGAYYRLQRQTVEGKVIFAKFPELDSGRSTKSHYLHVVEYEGYWWKAHLKFRDRLNDNPNLAKEYEALKIKNAEKYKDDAFTYIEAKEWFVNMVIQ
ncbi:GrpB family protein [Tenuibacillus multivorans]|uniref:GrpB domain, predicted nucleotidyltransferase, UPF0157 family n=1 Tax=Tenuibacillus multivorans TaxID=237069 RepID=A0A1G9WF66_9BACI|nr:GrpB family protein [Tenuibacillus multivorans]GEL76435.1 hypothetical protein TMU01_06700 [Tenuibacillus multivorans]SDM83129.1 GrpB domain, predicted nucleotidyltransferase, UPF0157 family [Tenuibacillus multivorans]